MKLIVIGGSREAEDLCARVPGAVLVDDRALPDDFNADAVVDASHPCERKTPQQVREKCARAGLPLVRFRRAAWRVTPQDTWIDVADSQAAFAALTQRIKRVFLCLGEADRAPFAGDKRRHYLIRTRHLSSAEPRPAFFEVTDKAGPFSVDAEGALMTHHKIDVLVTRNAGGQGAIPKVLAARALGVPVIMVARPLAYTDEVATIEEALLWLNSYAGQ